MENDDVDPPRRPAWGLQSSKGSCAETFPCVFPFAFGIHVPLRLPHIPRPLLYIRSIPLTSPPWSISSSPLWFLLSRNSPLFINRSQLIFISSAPWVAVSLSLSLFLYLRISPCWWKLVFSSDIVPSVCLRLLYLPQILVSWFVRWLDCGRLFTCTRQAQFVCLFVGWSGLGFWPYFRIID